MSRKFLQEFFSGLFFKLEAYLDESGFYMIYFASSRRWAGGFLPTEGSSLLGANYHTRLPT